MYLILHLYPSHRINGPLVLCWCKACGSSKLVTMQFSVRNIVSLCLINFLAQNEHVCTQARQVIRNDCVYSFLAQFVALIGRPTHSPLQNHQIRFHVC